MADQALFEFMQSAVECANEIQFNAAFIEQEMPILELSEENRGRIVATCSALAESKHGIAHELGELPFLNSYDGSRADLCVARIVEIVLEDLRLMRGLTDTLEADSSAGFAYTLLEGAGDNILRKLAILRQAASRYHDTIWG
jgi:hypothetical protein